MLIGYETKHMCIKVWCYTRIKKSHFTTQFRLLKKLYDFEVFDIFIIFPLQNTYLLYKYQVFTILNSQNKPYFVQLYKFKYNC